MSSRSRDLDELIRQKSFLGSRLSSKDHEYAEYAGGSYPISSQIAMIDLFIENGLIPTQMSAYLKLVRAHLVKQRKAFFVTVGSDILTQLTILVGEDREWINATDIDTNAD